MGEEAGGWKASEAVRPAPAKWPKTGGRVKKPLDQLLAEARARRARQHARRLDIARGARCDTDFRGRCRDARQASVG